jgi:hypothetical protein
MPYYNGGESNRGFRKTLGRKVKTNPLDKSTQHVLLNLKNSKNSILDFKYNKIDI